MRIKDRPAGCPTKVDDDRSGRSNKDRSDFARRTASGAAGTNTAGLFSRGVNCRVPELTSRPSLL
jgi:hypothetical protein